MRGWGGVRRMKDIYIYISRQGGELSTIGLLDRIVGWDPRVLGINSNSGDDSSTEIMRRRDYSCSVTLSESVPGTSNFSCSRVVGTTWDE